MRACLLVLLLAACAEPVDSVALRAAPPPAAPTEAPEAAAALASLLRARHLEDLPTREVLDRHPEPDVALAWLARHGDSTLVRTRALSLLGLFPERDHGALLAEHAAADQHPSIRAAALDGLAGYPAAERERRRDVIASALRSPNPKVALAGARASAGVPALAPVLERAVSEHPDPRVRER